MTINIESSLDYQWLNFSELSKELVYEILSLRQNIFIVEQECWYQDADGKDLEALHLTVKNNGSLVGYLRVLEPGTSYSEPSLGRILVRKDYRAIDTFTNFTSLIDDLYEEKVSHLLLVTSDYHIDRARHVGMIIAGSRGIKVTSLPITCYSKCIKESNNKMKIDVIRSIAWVITGRDLKQIFLKAWNYN